MLGSSVLLVDDWTKVRFLSVKRRFAACSGSSGFRFFDVLLSMIISNTGPWVLL